MASKEFARIRLRLVELKRAKRHPFPEPGTRLEAPNEQGVYVIYSPKGEVLHVGRTYRGTAGLRQRLSNHLHAASSFTIKYLKGRGAKLRNGYSFSFVLVPEPRIRALLEAFATGSLCPRHLGMSDKSK